MSCRTNQLYGFNVSMTGGLTTVCTDDKTSKDHHFEGAAELGESHQAPTNEGEQVVYEHAFPPAENKPSSLW